MPSPRLAAAVVLSVSLIAGGAAPAAAQVTVELVPFVGSYFPISSFATATAEPPGQGRVDYSYKQTIGVSGGAKLRVGFSDALAAEVLGSYTESGWIEDQNYENPAIYDVGFSLPGSIVMAQARLNLRPRRKNAYGIVGVSWMQRGGKAWDEKFRNSSYNKSNVGGVIGIGTRAPATPSLVFDITAELNLYSVKKVERGLTNPFASGVDAKSFQQDLVVTVGIPIGLTGR